MGAEELYSCRDHGYPILHNTTIEMHLTHEQAAFLLTDMESGLYFPTDVSFDGQPATSRDSLQVGPHSQQVFAFDPLEEY